MPIPDPKAGSVFIWIVSFFLFLSVSSGGGLLLYYMTAKNTAPWYPFAGVGLICLPWFFWFLTCLYRIFSRILGLRNGDPGGGAGGSVKVGNKTAGEIVQHTESSKCAASQDLSPGSGGRQVHFEAAMVVNEQEGHGKGGGQYHDQEEMVDLKKHGSSTSSSNDISFRSHESELPLTLSMAS